MTYCLTTFLRARAPVVLVAATMWLSSVAPVGAGSKVRVVTTTTDLKTLTETVGGDLVEVDALVRGNQNPHDFEVRPSQMVKLRRADLVILNGLELDAWAEVSIQGANNPRLIPGAPGRLDASAGIPVLEVPTGKVDRSMGDVHPTGNPHYTLDPGMASTITANIVAGLARVAPESRPAFEQGRTAFLAKLEPAMAQWAQMLGPVRGAKVVVDHNLWAYFFGRYGLVQVGTVEERPGIPATPAHLVRLAAQMKAEGVKALLTAPWGDRRLAERLAAESGARVVVMAPGAGAVKGTDTYLDWVAYNVNTLAQALR
jgi:ABC-type Zn uptake system ZnuABC Zn-binding protein ZnuA